MLQAIDYKTGKIRWSHAWKSGGPTGVLEHRRATSCSPAARGGLEALNATTGEPLWHSRIGTVTNGPITYELDGEQQVVVASGNNVFAFVMNK